MNSPNRHASTRQQVEATLQSYARFGVDLGLDRIENLLAALDNPHHHFPIVHVAGTNGKGSVCAYLSAVLKAAGYRTGRYTSPHLVNWTERICIDEVPIFWADLHDALAKVTAAVANGIQPIPTQFEILTAAAWQYFADQRVDIAVVEVGLGGRLDATNVWQKPLATVIVSIGRDHWQRLGPTLADIAGEKAGILKAGVPALAGPLPAEAKAVVTARAAELQAPLTWVTPAQVVTSNPSAASKSATPTADLVYAGIQYPQALLGDHQLINSACAIATLQTLRTQGWQISDEAIVQGMAQVKWPGRLQKTQWQGHDLLIDGAHNADSAKSLRTYIDQTFPAQPITWLMGMLLGKDHPAILAALLRAGDRLHLVPVPGHLGAKPSQLAEIAQQICPMATTSLHDTLATGLAAATQTSPTVLCGSLYLIGQYYESFFDA
jgi:dihydrofolate synthase / folylpolyglutamate synthase